jgi:hypothetical protein
MILRLLTFLAGLSGAAALSQFPEFSQQYVQRLGGAVDALAGVVDDFDNSAASQGLSREAALAQMSGTAFLEGRRQDMQQSFQRYDRLQGQLDEMGRAGPFLRAYLSVSADGKLVRAVYQNYKPALPLTLEGGIFALLGYLIGAIVFTLVVKSMAWLRMRLGLRVTDV